MTTHKTIEQWAEEVSLENYPINTLENGHDKNLWPRAYFKSGLCAGAEKQKELSDEREKVLIGIIDEVWATSRFYRGHADCKREASYFKCKCSFCVGDDLHCKTIASVEQKLKELKGKGLTNERNEI